MPMGPSGPLQFAPGAHHRGIAPHPNMMTPQYPMDPSRYPVPPHSKKEYPDPGQQFGYLHDQQHQDPRMMSMMRPQGPHHYLDSHMQNIHGRPLPPGYVLDNRGVPILIDSNRTAMSDPQRPPISKREDVHSPILSQQLENPNPNVPSNIVNRTPGNSSQLESSDSFSSNEGNSNVPPKRRGRGLGKKTLAKQAAAAAAALGSGTSNPGSDGNVSSPGSSSSIPEGGVIFCNKKCKLF